MSGNEFFYLENGDKQDKDLHNPILNDGPKHVSKQTLALAKEAGLSDREIQALFGGVPDHIRKKYAAKRGKK